MKALLLLLATALLLAPPAWCGPQVEKISPASPDAQKLPEDLFRLPPGIWAFGEHLWKDDAPCTADACEAGYTSGDLVVSVERAKTQLRVIAGFRGCASVAWNGFEIGTTGSNSDTKSIARRVKKAVGTSAKYCKVTAPTVPELDARRLFPAPAPQPAATPTPAP